ncbi:hypothetical protein BJX61DRAFT_312711 [Aspergillus egyptiacus]|nr:hypothetical protein BJX61DRAFT_312711 [Aspergillus egyptiacus]
MSASSLTTAATLFGGPGRASNSTPSVNSSATFHFVLDHHIRTLSDQNAPKEGPIRGLLFVPSLDGDVACEETTSPYIPTNVTRHRDVARFGDQAIGLAPWVTPDCSESFLESSKRVGTEALLFFLPSDNDAKPPSADDSTWLINGAHSWESVSQFPVYAIPASAGTTLMEQLSRYSGNGTIPPGQLNEPASTSLGEGWDMRLSSLINIERSGKKSPSIWGFVLAVLGSMLVICITLLLLYQLVQKRRRERMQRRRETRDIDYENWALQHIPVPPGYLAKLPIYTYPEYDKVDEAIPQERTSCGNDRPDRSEAPAADVGQMRAGKKTEGEEAETQVAKRDATGLENARNAKSATVGIEDIPSRPSSSESIPATICNSNVRYPKHTNRMSHSQPTCAICLDDFIPASTTVRELPCGHIYHPECIDEALTMNSSLCPLCKQSVLPPDFYAITTPDAVYQQDMREP